MKKAIIICLAVILLMGVLIYYYPLVGICLSIASFGMMLLILRNAKEIKNENDKLYDHR